MSNKYRSLVLMLGMLVASSIIFEACELADYNDVEMNKTDTLDQFIEDNVPSYVQSETGCQKCQCPVPEYCE